MKKELCVKGMTCEHCQKMVQSTLLEIEGVEDVFINLESGKVILTLKEDLSLDIFINAIESLGYEVMKSDEKGCGE